jgi:heptosyltransferase I
VPPTRIALIKTSSMGDVIHALPVVTDLRRSIGAVEIDWVVEEAFADLPALHPGVNNVVKVAVRRWRRAWFAASTRAELASLRARLRSSEYDLVIDLQGLYKSAWIARMTGRPTAGFSMRCAREPLAALSYDRRFGVDMTLHAIERLRHLAAQAVGYPVEGLPVFGLSVAPKRPEGVPETRYAVLLHATSRPEKQWPIANWRALLRSLSAQAITALLPWANDAEREQAEAIAGADAGARVLPRLTLAECATMLAQAHCVIGVDTGLTHLAAALETRTVALFSATPAWRFGPYWTPRAVSLGQPGAWPTPSDVMQALDELT